jgi:excisionase family DNA binding protein
MTIEPSLADIFVSGILQAANQLQVQYSQPQTDAAPLSAPARLRFGGRMKISPEELAESLGVSGRTISRWQSRRVIPYYRIGRRVLFDVAEVEHALRGYRYIAVGEPRPRKRRMERI